jgi:hypothetical protein
MERDGLEGAESPYETSGRTSDRGSGSTYDRDTTADWYDAYHRYGWDEPHDPYKRGEADPQADDDWWDMPTGPAYFGLPPGAARDRRPADVRRMGLSRHTEEGALVDFAARLNPTRPGHRVIAGVMLLVFAAPALYMLTLLL